MPDRLFVYWTCHEQADSLPVSDSAVLAYPVDGGVHLVCESSDIHALLLRKLHQRSVRANDSVGRFVLFVPVVHGCDQGKSELRDLLRSSGFYITEPTVAAA